MVAAVAGVSAEGNPQIPSELHRCPPVKWQPTQHKSTYLTDRVRGVAVPLVSSGSAGAHIGTGRRTHSHTDTQTQRTHEHRDMGISSHSTPGATYDMGSDLGAKQPHRDRRAASVLGSCQARPPPSLGVSMRTSTPTAHTCPGTTPSAHLRSWCGT